jgi:hypothetical protein
MACKNIINQGGYMDVDTWVGDTNVNDCNLTTGPSELVCKIKNHLGPLLTIDLNCSSLNGCVNPVNIRTHVPPIPNGNAVWSPPSSKPRIKAPGTATQDTLACLYTYQYVNVPSSSLPTFYLTVDI